MKMNRIYISSSRNPFANLAIEDYFLNNHASDERIIFLYENNNGIILGRFQNPWYECRTGLAEERAIPVLRRVSGGGTVIHGPGNLNFSIISRDAVQRKRETLQEVCKVLSQLGLEARINSRFDLVARHPGENAKEFRKFSGTALRQLASMSMHHATLLVNANLDELKTLIRPSMRHIRQRAIASVHSSMVNLQEINQNISISVLIDALANEWKGSRTVEKLDLVKLGEELEHIKKRLESFEWIWGKTPPFTESFSNWPQEDDSNLVFSVKSALIESVCLPEDREEYQSTMNRLIGCKYRGKSVSSRLSGLMEDDLLCRLAGLIEGEK